MKRALLFLIIATQLLSAEGPSEKALKYHQILQKRPSSGYVFDRFYDTWLDSATNTELEKFLKEKARAGAANDQLLLAYYYLRQGKELEAIQLYNNALKEKPGDPAISLQKAKLEARLLNFEGALKDLEAAILKADDDQKTDIYHLQGRYLVRSGKPEEATKIWKSLLAKNPTNSDLIDSILETQLSEGLFEEALATSDLQIKNTRDPYKKVLQILRRGDIFQRSGKRSKAINTYTSALDAVGQDSWLEREILAQLKEIFRREDNLAGLSTLYAELSKKYPQRMGIRKAHAHLLASLGENDKSEALFREILKATPGNRKNREELISILLKVGKNDAALAELKRLIKDNPKDVNLHLKLAAVLHKAGKKDEIKTPLDAYLKLSQNSPAAFIRVSGLLEKYELIVDAEKTLRNSIVTHPENFECRGALAKHLAAHDKKEEAVALWKKMIATGKRDTVVRQATQLQRAGEDKLAYELMKGRVKDFGQDISYLSLLAKEALKHKDYNSATDWSMRILKLAKHVEELRQAVKLNAQIAIKAEKEGELTKSLAEKKTRPPVESWLLAELYELQGRSKEAVGVLAALRESQDASDQEIAAIAEVALYEYRGDWQNAAAATERMIALPKGKKPTNLRRIVEFYERLDQIDKALKHIETWKQIAPGDKAPWFKQADLLSANGNVQEAITTMRRASQRFEEDASFHSKLAALYQYNDQHASAERLYWRLYEEAKNLEDRLRWVPMLAEVAEEQGRGNDLILRFEEKKNNNRKSIEPLLALAEIHRFNENYEERRKAMLEASRLRPNDTSILLNIARTEEREGEVERALAAFEKVAEIDKSDRTQRALAQFYLRNDEVEKGIGMIRELAGGANASPRDLEKAAISIARAGEIDDALKLTADALTANSDDYRLAFLRAALLNQDERPLEAVNQLLAGLSMNTELKGVKPFQTKEQWNQQFQASGGYLPKTQMYFLYDNHAARLITKPNKNARFTGYSSHGANTSFSLPGSLHEKQPLIEGAIVALYSRLDEDEQKRLLPELAAAGLKDVEYRALLSSSMNQNRGLQTNALKEYAKKNPERPEVFYFPLMYECMQALYGRLYGSGRNNKIDTEFLKFALKNAQSLNPYQRFSIETILIIDKKDKTAEEDWNRLIDAAQKLKEEEKLAAANFLALAMSSQEKLPSQIGDQLLALATKWHWQPNKKKQGRVFYNQSFLGQAILSHYAKRKDIENLLQFLEKECQAYDKLKKPFGASPMQAMMFGGRGQSKFTSPTFPPSKYTGVPTIITQIFKTEGKEVRPNPFPRSHVFQPIDLDELALNKHLAKVKHPYLRIHISHAYGEEEEVKKGIKLISSGDEPSLVATFYQAGYYSSQKQWGQASAVLAKARFLPIKREDRKAIDEYITALALSVQEADLAEKHPAAIEEGQRAALRLRRSMIAPQDRQRLITALDDLGLQKEADLVASKSVPSRSISSPFVSGSSSSKSDLKKLEAALTAGEKEKSERLALRVMKAHLREPSGWQKFSNQKKIRDLFKQYELIELVKEEMNPVGSTSLRRRADYALMLYTLGLNDEALPLMRELARKGSKNRDLLIALTFKLPAEEKELAAKYFEKALKMQAANPYGGMNEMYAIFQQLENESIEAWLNANEFLAYYLSVAPKNDKKSPSLGWVQQAARRIVSSAHVSGMSFQDIGTKASAESIKKDKKGYLKRRLEIAVSILKHSMAHRELAAWAFPSYYNYQVGHNGNKETIRALAVVALENATLFQHDQRNGSRSMGYVTYGNRGNPGKTPIQFIIADAWATKNKEIFPQSTMDLLRKKDKKLVVPLEYVRQTLFLDKAELERAIVKKITQKSDGDLEVGTESAKVIAEICLARKHLSPALEKWFSTKWPTDDIQQWQYRIQITQSALPTYLGMLTEHDASRVSPLIENIIQAIIQPDGNLADFLKKNKQNSYTAVGTDPRFRISTAETILRGISKGDNVVGAIHLFRAMKNTGFPEKDIINSSYAVTNFRPKTVDHVLDILTQAGFGNAKTQSELVALKFNNGSPNAFAALVNQTKDRVRDHKNSSWGINVKDVEKKLTENKLTKTQRLFLQIVLLSTRYTQLDKKELLLKTLTEHQKTIQAWDADIGLWFVNTVIQPTLLDKKSGQSKIPSDYPKAIKSLIEKLSSAVDSAVSDKFGKILEIEKVADSDELSSLDANIRAGSKSYLSNNRKQLIAVLSQMRKLRQDYMEGELSEGKMGSPYRSSYFKDPSTDLEVHVIDLLKSNKHGARMGFMKEYVEHAKLPNISIKLLDRIAAEIASLHSDLTTSSQEKRHLKELEKMVKSYEKLPKETHPYIAIPIVRFMMKSYRGNKSVQEKALNHFVVLNKKKPSMVKQAIIVGFGANIVEHMDTAWGRKAASETHQLYRALPNDCLRNSLSEALASEGGEMFCDSAVAGEALDAMLRRIDEMDIHQTYSACRALHGLAFNNLASVNKDKFTDLYKKLDARLKSYRRRSAQTTYYSSGSQQFREDNNFSHVSQCMLGLALASGSDATVATTVRNYKNEIAGDPYAVIMALRHGRPKVAHQLWRSNKRTRGYSDKSHVPMPATSPMGLVDNNLLQALDEFIKMAPKDADRFQLRDAIYTRNSTYIEAEKPAMSFEERSMLLLDKFLMEKKYGAAAASEIMANIMDVSRYTKQHRYEDALARSAMKPAAWIVPALLRANNNNLSGNWKSQYYYPVTLYFYHLVMEGNVEELQAVIDGMIKAGTNSSRTSRMLLSTYPATSWVLDRVIEAIESGDTQKIEHYRKLVEPFARFAISYKRYSLSSRYSMSVAVHALCYAYSEEPEKFLVFADEVGKKYPDVVKRKLMDSFLLFDSLLHATYKGKSLSHKDHEDLQLKIFTQIIKAVQRGMMKPIHLRETEGYYCLAALQRRKLISKQTYNKLMATLPKPLQLGKWTPELIGDGSKKESKELVLDATKAIQSNGTYMVTFIYQKGKFRLDIHGVKLLKDKTHLVAEDNHHGSSGTAKHKNAYLIEVKDYQKDAKYHVSAKVFGDQGNDSYGVVRITRIK